MTQATTTASIQSHPTSQSNPAWRSSVDHRFYVGSAVVSLAVAMIGFGPGFVDASLRRGPLTPLAALHAVIFTGWLILYFTQTLLASRGNIRLHRRFGIAGAVLAPVMLVVGYQTTIEMVRRGFDVSGDLDRLGPVMLQTPFQILGMPIFGALVLGALLYRRRPDVHKRLMWLSISFGLLGAPVVHTIGHYGLPPVVAPLAILMLLAANPIHDRIVHGRIHPVSLWGSIGCFALGNVLAGVVAPHPQWEAFVLWLAR